MTEGRVPQDDSRFRGASGECAENPNPTGKSGLSGQETLNHARRRPDSKHMSDSDREPLAHAPSWSRTIVYHASRDALGPKTDVILSRLGYQMLLPETFEEMREEHPELELRLRVAPSRQLLDELEAGELDVVVCVVVGKL